MSLREGLNGRVVRAVLRNELRGLLRDRRALFAAIVLPMLLYPATFLGTRALKDASRERMSEETVSLALDLAGLDANLAAAITESLGAEELRFDLTAPPAAPEPTMDLGPVIDASQPASEGSEATLTLAALPRAPSPPGGADDPSEAVPVLVITGDFSSELGSEGKRRLQEQLERLQVELEGERYQIALGSDPAAPWRATEFDVARAEDHGGLALGKLLPLIAILVILSGGSFAALDAFAGERERGTLETLLVQPVPVLSVAVGKFVAVLLACVAAVVGNVGSLALSAALGFGVLPGAEAGVELSAPRLFAGLVPLVPVAALLASVLCSVAARARTYREGQLTLLPISLVSLLPAAVAAAPGIELDAIWALVPLAGPSLAVRDTLRGTPIGFPFLLAVAATIGWTAWALRDLANTLDAERVLFGGDADIGERHAQSRRALAYGFAAVIALFLVGSNLQSRSPIAGLLATLYLVLPAIGWPAIRGTAKRAGESLSDALWLHLPRPAHALAIIPLALGAVVLVQRWAEWQHRLLPLPDESSLAGLAALFENLSPAAVFFIFAISPALMEELFFRGAILSGLRRDMSATRVIAWQSLLFALAHLSIHRLVPTAIVGALAAWIVLRTRSLWLAIGMHALYNAVQILPTVTREDLPRAPTWALMLLPLGAVLLHLSSKPADQRSP